MTDQFKFGEPAIMPVRPGFISPEDRAELRSAGVIVVEVAEPEKLFLIRPDSMVSSKGMLYAAMKGLQRTDAGRVDFATEIYAQVCQAWKVKP